MQPGERHGRYELVRMLGEGGMGRVWEAVLHGPGGFRKRVALKVLKTGGAGLAREARLGGLLRHLHLVEVYALEQLGDTWVCAMELVEGGPISRHLPLPPSAVVEAGWQICAGLAHAHQEIGLIHLDLKPDNVLVDRGIVKVADLGIARARGLSSDPILQGTPAYMAPEQAAGQTLDARADVYSMGVLLVAMARGSHGRAPSLVPFLEEVLERCLATDPADRFADMAELGEALAAVDVEGPSLAEALGQWQGTLGATPLPAPGRTVRADTFRLEPAPVSSTNLPGEEPDPFVGRTTELDRLLEALDQPGLLTLKGLGGLGKTRLARRAARAWHQGSGGSAWFVDLTAARTVEDVVDAVAQTLEIPLAGSGDDGEQVGFAILGRGPLVVVLDNFEQVLDAAEVVRRWREQAPEARFLVTSREVLRLPGERVVPLDPLPESDARELLRLRGEALGVTVDDDEALGELARRLDGIPLALELAAGRLSMMGPAEILERLDQRFRLLRGSRRDRSDRQATLRGTLDWSWALCGPEEQAALAQLSVFAGGCTVEAAEAVLVLPDELWALDALEDLDARSLIGFRDGRLHLYESVRAYAAEKLEDPGPVEARHGAWYARLGTRQATEALHGKAGQERFDRLRAERANLVAAVERAVARGDVAVAVGCAAAVWEVFERLGPLDQGLALLRSVAAMTGLDAESRGRLEGMLGLACKVADQPEEALEHLDAARRIFAADGGAPDRRREGRALLWMAGLQEHAGRGDDARENVERALAIARETGDRRAEALAHANRSNVLRFGGHLDEAVDAGITALRIQRKLGDQRAEVRTLVNLGHLYDGLGRFVESRAHMEAALELARALGDRRLEGLILGHLASQADARGEPSQTMHRGAVALAREVGSRRSEGVALSNLALALARTDDIDGAVDTMGRAIAALEDANAVRWVGFALGNLGHVLLADDRFDEAEEPLEQACRIARELDDAYGEGCWLAGLGALYSEREEVDRCFDTFDRAAVLLESGGHRHQRAKVAVMEADAAERHGFPDRAREATARVRAFLDGGGRGHDAALDASYQELDARYPSGDEGAL